MLRRGRCSVAIIISSKFILKQKQMIKCDQYFIAFSFKNLTYLSMELRMSWSRCSRSYRYDSCLRCGHRYCCLVVGMSRCIIRDRCMHRLLDKSSYRCLVISLMRGITIYGW